MSDPFHSRPLSEDEDTNPEMDWSQDEGDPDAPLPGEVRNKDRIDWAEEHLEEKDNRSYRNEEEPTFWYVKYATFGDYDNSCLVERANSKSLLEKYPNFVKTISGGHGSVWTGVSEEDIPGIPQDEWEMFVEDIEGLEDYPLMDEDLHSQMEMEAQDKAWEEDGQRDLKEECIKRASDPFEKFVYAKMSNEDWSEVRYKLEQNSDIGWYQEVDYCGFHAERVAPKVNIDDVPNHEERFRPFFEQAQKDIWNNWLATYFDRLLQRQFARDEEIQSALLNLNNSRLWRLFERLVDRSNWEVWTVEKGNDYDLDVDKQGVTETVKDARREDILRRDFGPERGQLRLKLEAGARLVNKLLETGDEDWSEDAEASVGNDSTEEVYEDKYVRLFQPKTVYTYNRYAEMISSAMGRPATLPEIRYHVNRLKWVFIAIVKGTEKPVPLFYEFDSDGNPISQGTNAIVNSRPETPGPTKSIRIGLSRYARRMADPDGDDADDYKAWLMILVRTASDKRMLKALTGMDMERYIAWLLVASLLEQGDLESARAVMSASGIDASHNVRLEQDSFLRLWDDWDSMVDLFNKEDRKGAARVFSGELEVYDSGIKWVDVFGDLSEGTLNEIRKLLVGMPWDSDEGGTAPLTEEEAHNLGVNDIKFILQEVEEAEPIADAITTGGSWANQSATEDAYFKAYQSALESELGSVDGPQWLQVPGKDRAGDPTNYSRIGFRFKYKKIRAWLDDYQGSAYGVDGQYDGDNFHDLVSGAVRVAAPDNVSTYEEFNSEQFNDNVIENLPKTLPWHKHHPNQTPGGPE